MSSVKSNKLSVNVMWFKRDLRLRDNEALYKAVTDSNNNDVPLLLLYIFEPLLIADPHYTVRHWRFVSQSLDGLNRQLGHLTTGALDLQEWPNVIVEKNTTVLSNSNARIHIFHNEVDTVFNMLTSEYCIRKVFSYEETGLKLTFDRDKTLIKYCKENNISWIEQPTNGILRGKKDLGQWLDRWKQTMATPQRHPDFKDISFVVLSKALENSLKGPDLPSPWYKEDKNFQYGGEDHAHIVLDSFLSKRIYAFSESLSKPLESREGCSRLSPYIAWGCLSVRQVYQALNLAMSEVSRCNGDITEFKKFLPRLRWQGNFTQEFESNDHMEFEEIGHNVSSIRKNENEEHYQRWCDGTTGYPLIDACMRCLKDTGYINFRMRALLVSFLTHHLFQDWREGAKHLARYFTDFEPGLHYAQIQMQSGMGKQKTVRVYNPVKQSYDNDTEGDFIRMWIPELVNCSGKEIHEPWKMTILQQQFYGVEIGKTYPFPVVDIVETGRYARLMLYAPRKKT